MSTHARRLNPEQPGAYEFYTVGQPISGPDDQGIIVQHHGDAYLLALDNWLLIVDRDYDAGQYKTIPGQYTDDEVKVYLELVEFSPEELAANLSRAKEDCRNIIRAAFEAEEVKPVMDATGRWWNGGLASALRLDGGRRLAVETGQLSVVFYDIFNAPHDLIIANASVVIYTVAGAFRVDFDHKQALMAQIDAAETVEAMEAIVW